MVTLAAEELPAAELCRDAEILCFVPRLDRSGAPTSALLLLSALVRTRPMAVLALEEGPLAAEFRKARMPVLPLGSPGWRGRRWRRRLDEYLSSPRLRGVHINNLCPEAVPVARAARRRSVPVLWHIREDPRSRRAIRLRGALLKFSDGVVTVSEEIRRNLFPADLPVPVVTVHNGVLLRPSRPSAPALRAGQGWGADCVVIGLVGRLVPRKGVRELLLAARALVARHPSARFLLVGRWEEASSSARTFKREMQELMSAPELAGRLACPGEIDSPLEALEACDIVAVPSWWEGSSRTLLEAMACGRAVVASAAGGNPEIVEDGVSGLLVPARDPAALARALGSVAADAGARRRLGEAARVRIEQHFSLAEHRARVEEVYARVFRPSLQEARSVGRQA